MSKVSPSQIWREAKREYPLLNSQGKLLFWTNVLTYHVGLIRLSNKETISGQIVDVGELTLKKGLKLRAVVRRLIVGGKEEPIRYGIKWRIEK